MMKLKKNNVISIIRTDQSKPNNNKNKHHYIIITAKLMLLLSFIIISGIIICPTIPKSRCPIRASSLQKVVTNKEGYVRIDYYDSDNTLTFATDIGYASKTITVIDGGKIERFYDENREPVEQTGNYFAVRNEYDENGRNIKSIYLDQNLIPVTISTGFSSIHRTFYENGMIKTEKYYDRNDNPVWTNGYGYGRLIKYDENGFIREITYMNENGDIASNGLGYARVTRQYYAPDSINIGRVEYEYYFDDHGKPTKRSLGQYGVHKEYDDNGNEVKTTYLDENGKPVKTTKGYTSIIRTYNEDGSVAKEQYIDSDGKPVQLAGGQYGQKSKDGQIIYLDEKGNDQFNIKQLLYNNSELVIIIALIIVLLSLTSSKRMNYFFFVAYLGVIAYMTLLLRENNGTQINLNAFWSYKVFFSNPSARSDIIKNIWLFIPLGTIVYRISPRKIILLIPCIVSIAVETIQLFSHTGFYEIDDIISNGLGGLIGYLIGRLIDRLSSHIMHYISLFQ